MLYYTGMRACDVAALRLDSIDWELDLVEIVQAKTGVPLTLPLTAHVGNAVWDYVNGDRGASTVPNVFVSRRWPYGAISADAVRSVSAKIFDAAGVRCTPGCRRGTHLFRRTAATAMLGSGAERSVIAAALGHSSPVTTERYIAADVDGLRRRAIDVSGFPVAEGVLS
ncbi:MAG: tyrosine-type recombinase/integrase [Atopobiaceae bacterium]|nr:tyrosine-type recombinase/integrase [Atopobiaceae bacterium]